jgi:DNA (cytosine-5)-methyltransferase 1
VAQPIAFSRNDDGRDVTINLAPTMRVAGRAGGVLAAAIEQPIPINSMNALRGADADPTTGCGIGEAGEAMFTLTKGHSHAVAQPITFKMDGDIMGDVAGTMTTREGNISDTAHAVMQPIPINTMNHVGRGDNHSSGDFKPGAPAYTLTKGHSHAVAHPMAFDAYNQTQSDTTAALRCAAGGVYDNTVAQPIPFDTTQITSPANYSKPQAGDPCHPLAAGAHAPAVAQPMAVRRLTPVECERLQGFPDGYTNIPWRKKPESPDGPRYKALGNSWAVPVVAWIGKRINEAVK